MVMPGVYDGLAKLSLEAGLRLAFRPGAASCPADLTSTSLLRRDVHPPMENGAAPDLLVLGRWYHGYGNAMNV